MGEICQDRLPILLLVGQPWCLEIMTQLGAVRNILSAFPMSATVSCLFEYSVADWSQQPGEQDTLAEA